MTPISSCFQKRSFLQFFKCVAEFVLGVHHDRAVPGDRFLQGLAGDRGEANAVVAGVDGDFVAAVEQNQRAVLGRRGRDRLQPLDSFGRDRQGPRRVAEFAAAGEDVGERVTGRFNRQALANAGRDRDVEVDQIVRDPLDGALFSQNVPQTIRARVPSSSVTSEYGRLHFLVKRGGHLEKRREDWPTTGSRACGPRRSPLGISW